MTAGSAKAVLLCVAGAVAACNGSPEATQHAQRLAAFGTIVSISASQTSQATFDLALADLEKYFQKIGRDWYPWAPGELAAVNAALAEGREIQVSPPLQRLLQRALDLELQSNGRFNAGLGELTELWAFNEPDRDNWQPPDGNQIAAIMGSKPGLALLRWSDDSLSAAGPGLKLDLGGIAKGAILEQAMNILHRHGIDNAIVDIGGDLMVRGQVAKREARIGIRRPDGDGVLAWVEIESGEAVMTSGNYERYFAYDGKRYAHILDPRSGYPADGTASVTVIHRDPVVADAAATALLVGGSAEFAALCKQLGIDFALLVATSGDLRLTDGMRGRVNWLSR